MINGVKEILNDFVCRMENLKDQDVSSGPVLSGFAAFSNLTMENRNGPGNNDSTEIFGSMHGTTKRDGSFASVLQITNNKKVVKIKELRNEAVVEGAAVAIPFDAVKEVKSRFANTLYGFFIGKRLAFPLVENYMKNT